jgi:Putative Flp pilus-assembly TadE/G-like
MRLRDDRGQAVPLALIAVALAILATVALAELGGNVVDAGRARTAADAAALAGVEGGHEASSRVAAENGATLIAWSSRPDGDGVTVTVRVQIGRAAATASASNRGP